MEHLSEDDIEKLFSGAPQYFARSESHFHGAPHPIVAFPFDEELEIRDLTDHVPVENKAWAGLTAWPHLPQHRKAGSLCARQHEERHKAHFHVRCRERPNMLSMQGLEKGTMGYQAALELAVGDSLEEGQFGFTAIGTRSQAVAEARERIMSTEGYLRPLSESELLERLRCSGRLYRENDLRKRKLVDSYKDLFHSFMRPYSTVIDKTDHYSLENQIVAILRCLGTPNVWLDFSRVEWRIRLGQVLWGCRDGDELEDSTSIHDAGSADGRQEERRWLLTQIIVATELLVRLDAITKGVECGAGAIKPIDAAYFERGATPTVKWSLLLARNWLENVEVVREQATRQDKELHRRSGSWLTSFVGKMSSKYYRPPCAHFLSNYSLYPRYLQRQIDGLMHFARKLRWPNVDQLEARIAEKVQKAAKANSSPQSSSHSPARSRHSSSSDTSSTTKSGSVLDEKEKAALPPARRRKLAAELHECGWLSKSYVFGLVLPGEGLYHCLMATLVESDCEAMSKLGSLANLSGGFVYSPKSFWSTTCIVGRVLAAGRGAAECMGWVSTDVLPQDMKDGWLGIEVKNVEEDMAHLGKKARLWAKKSIERESSILGGADEFSVRPADFFIPNENSSYTTPPPGVDVKLVSLDLTPASGSVAVYSLRGRAAGSVGEGGKAPSLLSYAASVKFSVSVEGTKREEYDYGLRYDINFATAHPCSPSHRVRLLKSVTSSAVERIDVSGSGMLGNGARPVHKMGHPLHKSYSYAVVHISELIRKPKGSVDEILAEHRSEPSQEGGDKRTVLVVDCITNVGSGLQPLQTMDSGTSNMQGPGASRDGKKCFSAAAAAKMHFESRKRQFGCDTEVLVRALCAQRGWNAIISRRKRGCLACAIREAGALGWRVIVRVE